MIVGTNGIVLDERGRVLLIRRDDILTWALPGGALEPGELPPDGVAREVEEETGVKVIPDRLPWPFLSLQRERLDQALRHEGGPPYWGRQRPSRWLRLARRTAGTVIYRWQDLKRHRRNLPPYQPPRPWNYGAFVIIRDEAGRVLWLKRTDHDVWNLPGGGPEAGETPGGTPWETAVRETWEDTGLTVRLTDLSGVYVKPADHSLIFAFLADVVGGQLTTGPEAAAFDYSASGQEPQNSLPKQVERAADATAVGRDATLFRIQDGPRGMEKLRLQS